MAAGMTYNSLLSDIELYADRHDTVFVDQMPRFVMLGENRIAAECRGLGFVTSVQGNLNAGAPDGQVLNKPARWRQTISISIGRGASFARRKYLKERSMEYCRSYWPNSDSEGEPVYYADWDYTHWLIAPTADLAYPFEILYHQRPTPLDEDNQTSWTTEYAPQLLLYACLLEAAPFVKRLDLIQIWQSMYDKARQEVEFESVARIGDRSSKVSDGAST